MIILAIKIHYKYLLLYACVVYRDCTSVFEAAASLVLGCS